MIYLRVFFSTSKSMCSFMSITLILGISVVCGVKLLHRDLEADYESTSDDSELNPETNTENKEPQIYNFTIIADIKYRYSRTVVSSRVSNPASISQEVKFAVTLPDSAFISEFLIQIDDKIYKADVKEKEEAKRTYTKAKKTGKTAGHVEMPTRDSNTFTISVNLEPLKMATFNLTYEEVLHRSIGQYKNIIYVNFGQLIPLVEIRWFIEESSKITVLDVLEFKTENEISDTVTKNRHALISKPKENIADIIWTCTMDEQRMIDPTGINGQITLLYDVDRDAESNQILVNNGYFVHFFAPTDLQKLPKYVIFVLDVSGSMNDEKIKQLKEGMKQILNEMSNEDCFSIILFSTGVQLWTLRGIEHELRISNSLFSDNNSKFIIPATKENVKKTIDFIETLLSQSSTNIMSALKHAIKFLEFGRDLYPDHQPILIFLTDGLPNVGDEVKPEVITKTVTVMNKNKCPIFSLAFGEDADYNFLRSLSLTNGGFTRKIYISGDTHLQLNNFYKEISSPLLTNISFKYVPDQVNERTLTKTRFNNYFSGSEIIVAGRVKKPEIEDISVDLQARVKNCTRYPFPKPLTFSKLSNDSGHLERIWAYLRIKQLLDADLIHGKRDSSYRKLALNISLNYGFVTPLTSLVIVKPNATEAEQLDLKPSKLLSGIMTEHVIKLSKHNVLWLDDTTKTVKFPGSDSEYPIYTSNPDTKYQNCTTMKYSKGSCRYFEFCIIPEIIYSFEDYVQYACITPNKFAGVCCPNGR